MDPSDSSGLILPNNEVMIRLVLTPGQSKLFENDGLLWARKEKDGWIKRRDAKIHQFSDSN